jgi:hypothetical protein
MSILKYINCNNLAPTTDGQCHPAKSDQRHWLFQSNLKRKFIFLAKSQFMRNSEGKNEKLPIKNDEEFSLVAEGGFEPPTFGL